MNMNGFMMNTGMPEWDDDFIPEPPPEPEEYPLPPIPDDGMASPAVPGWVVCHKNGVPYVNEPAFLAWFTSERELRYMNGKFFCIDGEIAEGAIRWEIQNAIAPFIQKNIARITDALYKGLANACYHDVQKASPYQIHVRNGVLFTNGDYLPERMFCVHRLAVDYTPDAAPPKRFLAFIEGLLYAEDIPTLQEYLGYCLVPSTKAQAMLFLIGSGGEGKSVLGDVLSALFHVNMTSGKIQTIATDRFMLGNLENKLLFLDDDINFEGIRDTGILKSLVTASAPLSIERKYCNRYDAMLYTRLLCFGNHCLNSLYDHTDGFYRRQIIIQTKPRPANRTDNPHLAQEIIDYELESVFLWMFEGLRRLIENHWQIRISQRARDALAASKSDNFNLTMFLQDEAMFDPSYEIASADLYHNYEEWCRTNGLTPIKRDAVVSHLRSYQDRYGIRYSMNCKNYQGRKARGFRGIRTKTKCTYQLL